MSILQGASNFNIQNSNFNQIHGNATIIRFGDGKFTQDDRNFIRDIISTNATLPNDQVNLIKKFLTQLITNLPRAEAMFNDYQNKKKGGPCFEGTRVALLREMADWVTDLDGSRMFVLSGLAGIGKSTVAYTIASRAAGLNLLGASFFFSRDEADRNNAKKFFTTIAYQLCLFNEACAKAIGDALQTERGSAATTKDPQEQLQVLIIEPLRSIIESRTRPILVVVDALDECDEDDENTVMTGLSQLVQDLPPFKVILTTRPNAHLDSGQDGQKLLHLQNIEDKVVDNDIRLYLKHSLSLEQVRKRFPKKEWCASDKEIDSLVDATGRLFIVASTTVRYILDKTASNPAGQMRNLLRALAENRTLFKDLDHFYTVILRNVVPADCDDGIVSRYQSVVGAIVFVQQPLPVSTLTHLIDMDEDDIHGVLDHLQSVILLGDDNVPRIYHKSFPDYVTDQTRCKDVRLRIDPKFHHMQIASHCFEITNKLLKYNILGLGKMARYKSNEDGLKEDRINDKRLREKIPEQLRYACLYWANHLHEVATVENTNLMDGLVRFVTKHALHWIEVLSLIGNLDSAHHALSLVLDLLGSTSSDLQELLSDTLRFLLKFYEIFERSALHTYYSALPFSPTGSLLYRQFIEEAEHRAFVIEGGPEKWDALVASPSLGHNFDLIKFSRDSAMFFACFDGIMDKDFQGNLKIWDADTGTPKSTIPGQRFAVTNDFSTIASSNVNTITYYNTNGSKKGSMLTASLRIDGLALSDSGKIAAVLADRTVSLWETKDAKLIGTFNEFRGSKDRLRLRFSSTGTRLVYSLVHDSSVVKLRDGMSGRFIADLQCGSKHKFEFSGDGSRIACLSHKHGLTLWNSESGALIGKVKDSGWGALAISENGSTLATGGAYVSLWTQYHGDLVPIKTLEFEHAHSMAFSRKNILAIGSESDIKLYNIETRSFSTPPFREFPVYPAFSPNCTRLAYGCSSQLYLWNTQGIDTSEPPSNKAVAVTATALSRDCSHLACGYQDGRVELWGTSPAMRRIASHQAHEISNMAFGPDGRLFASMSPSGIISLWNGKDGSLHGTLQAPEDSKAVALSNSMLVAGRLSGATLWSLDTLSPIHTFQKHNEYREYHSYQVTISDESDLVATASYGRVTVFDVKNRTLIDIFKASDNPIYKLTFLPNKSHLVVQLKDGAFLEYNLAKKHVTKGAVLKHLMQLPNTPRWHRVPIWTCLTEGQYCFSALFLQHKSSVPLLWIPGDLSGRNFTEGSSMIAVGCSDGRIILLRLLSTSHID